MPQGCKTVQTAQDQNHSDTLYWYVVLMHSISAKMSASAHTFPNVFTQSINLALESHPKSEDGRSLLHCGARQSMMDDLLSLADDLLQMLLIAKTLCVDLIDVLGARRPGGKPAILRHNL